MPIQRWQKLDDKIPDFLESTSEELAKAKEILGEDFPLFEKIRNGTPGERQETRSRLIVKHKGLVYWLANRFYSLLNYRFVDSAVERDDLVQEGMIGLMRALETYDYTKGFRFSVYAFYWVRQFILRCYQNRALPVRIPIKIQEKIRKIEKIADSLRIKLKRKPSRKEIAEAARITLEELENTIEKARVFQRILSLDAPVEESKDGKELFLSGLVESKEDFEEVFEKKEISLEFWKKLRKIFWLAGLKSREQYFLERFFGLDGRERETLQSIGDKQGITRERVRQIIDKALSKIQIPELSRLIKALSSGYRVPKSIPSYPWRRAFKLLELIEGQIKKGEKHTPELLIEMIASFFGLKLEQLKKSGNKNEIIEVARNTAIFLLFKVKGLSKAQICFLLNIEEATIEVSLAKFHEVLKIWGKEVLWIEPQPPKVKSIPEGNKPQFSVILNLLQNTNTTYFGIANLLNVSEGVVERVAKEAGINGKSRMLKRGQEKRRKVLEEILNHPEMTYDEIAKWFCLKKRRLSMIAQERGLKRRRGHRACSKIASRNQKILITAHQNPDLTYKEIGKPFDLSSTQICLILQRQGFHRFSGWHRSRLDTHKIKPIAKPGLKARNRKILEIVRNNPKLSYHQIGEMVGLSGLYVKEMAQRAGLFRRPRGSTKKREDLTFKKIFRLLGKKKDLKVVAKELNCSEMTLRRRLRQGEASRK